MLLASCAVVAGLAFSTASCSKDDDKEKGGNELIDDGGDDDDDNGGNGGNGGSTTTPASLQGSNYYPILIDAISYETIAGKVVADLRAQDGGDAASTRPLYVWNGYEGATANGLNFYGNAEGYTSLQVYADAGWSGFGIFLKKEDPGFAKMAEITGDYYFHFAYKGADGVSHAFYPGWGSSVYRMTIGNGAEFNDNGTIFPKINPISNDGKFVPNEWNEYEVKVSDMGIDFTAEPAEAGGQNILCALSGGVAGTTISLDAVFFYKK